MKVLELDGTVKREDCDIKIYKDLPLPLVMLQGWFNDQHKCFELFVDAITEGQALLLFTDADVLESVKQTYRKIWSEGAFNRVTLRHQGEHRRLEHLNFSGFAYWVKCVSNEVKKFGSLKALLTSLGTVEEAHSTFKRWFYKGKGPVRGLNAADAARILARYEYLIPEARPLLARGALRGAATLLEGRPRSWCIARVEREYAEEASRVMLEHRAAEYIDNSKCFCGKFQMELGESWFCQIHKNHRS